jgi:hypothetical protein
MYKLILTQLINITIRKNLVPIYQYGHHVSSLVKEILQQLDLPDEF